MTKSESDRGEPGLHPLDLTHQFSMTLRFKDRNLIDSGRTNIAMIATMIGVSPPTQKQDLPTIGAHELRRNEAGHTAAEGNAREHENDSVARMRRGANSATSAVAIGNTPAIPMPAIKRSQIRVVRSCARTEAQVKTPKTASRRYRRAAP